MKGNAAHGKDVFVAATCVTCHVINGQGTSYGPELSEIGTKLPKEAIYTSILYPSAGISHGYETYALETKKGNVLNGLLVSQTPAEVTLKGADALVIMTEWKAFRYLLSAPHLVHVEYRCPGCGCEFQTPPVRCPTCGAADENSD